MAKKKLTKKDKEVQDMADASARAFAKKEQRKADEARAASDEGSRHPVTCHCGRRDIVKDPKNWTCLEPTCKTQYINGYIVGTTGTDKIEDDVERRAAIDALNGIVGENSPTNDENAQKIKFRSAEDRADEKEIEREDDINHWLSAGHYGMSLVVQPLNKEPNVENVALGVFKKLTEDQPHMAWRELQMAALDSRELALILHGYHRMPIAEEDLPLEWFSIHLHYQNAPYASKTYKVETRTRDEAVENAHILCEKEHGHRGIVIAINGIEIKGEQ